MKLKTIYIFGLIALLIPISANANLYETQFDKIDQSINSGRGYSDQNNDTAYLGWGESYILQGYVEMYRATKDTHYLDRLVEHFDRVLANRDDVRKAADHYRKEPIAGWGATKYSSGRWHVWIVHTGMILLGPAQFVRLVKGDKDLSKHYGEKADLYLKEIKKSIADHEVDWRKGPKADEGYYTDPEVAATSGKEDIPLNMSNAFGAVQAELYMITRDKAYKERVEMIANFFKNRLRKNSDGSYDWAYHPNLNDSGGYSEDISHAGINVTFANTCCEAKIVFNEKDVKAFAKTFTAHISKGSGKWSDVVSGEGGTNKYVPGAIGGWIDLCKYDPQILKEAKRAFLPIEDMKGAWNLLGVAKLARWDQELKGKK